MNMNDLYNYSMQQRNVHGFGSESCRVGKCLMRGEAMQHIQNNNGNAQAAFYSLASELEVDPNEVLNLLR